MLTMLEKTVLRLWISTKFTKIFFKRSQTYVLCGNGLILIQITNKRWYNQHHKKQKKKPFLTISKTNFSYSQNVFQGRLNQVFSSYGLQPEPIKILGRGSKVWYSWINFEEPVSYSQLSITSFDLCQQLFLRKEHSLVKE